VKPFQKSRITTWQAVVPVGRVPSRGAVLPGLFISRPGPRRRLHRRPNYKRPQATTIPSAYTGATNVVATDSDATNAWKVAQPQPNSPRATGGNSSAILNSTNWNARPPPPINSLKSPSLAWPRPAPRWMSPAPVFSRTYPFQGHTLVNAPPRILPRVQLVSHRGRHVQRFYVPLSLGYEVDLWAASAAASNPPGRRPRPAPMTSKPSG